MKHNFKLFITSVVFALICGFVPAFAIDAYVTIIYRQVDVAFVDRSDKELDGILSSSNEDRNYYLIENYTMKKIRHLVVAEDYEFASEATLVVIDNNLDNMEAVELYSTISSALEKQKEQKLAIEQRKQAEQARFEAEKAKQRTIIEKEYVSMNTASGNTVYLKGKNEKLSSTYWAFRFGLFDGTFISDTSDDYSSFRYGLGGDFTYEYSFDKLMIGADIGGDAIIIPFFVDDSTIVGNFSLIPKISFSNLGKWLSFRAGFASVIKMDSGNGNDSCLQETVYSPVFGLGLNHINLGGAEFTLNADYLLGHLAYDGLNFALNSAINFALPIMKMDKIQLNFNIGLKDTLFVKDSGIENRAGIILAIGAQNVIK